MSDIEKLRQAAEEAQRAADFAQERYREAVKATSKFKVGDRVRIIGGYSYRGREGQVDEVVVKHGYNGLRWVDLPGYRLTLFKANGDLGTQRTDVRETEVEGA